MTRKYGIIMDEELGIPADRRDLPEYQFREWAAAMQV